MFKVRTVSLGRILTFSTAVLYLGYLWYKRKRTLSHRQSDKKRPSSEPSELIKIDDQELLQALEKASRTLEVSQIVEEEPIEDSVTCKKVMEPTISQVEIKEIKSFINNSDEMNGLDTKVITMPIEQVCLESPQVINSIESLTEDLNNLKLSIEVDQVNEAEVAEVVEDSIHIEKDSLVIKEECIKDKASWTEMVEKEDHCECPKAVIVKKVKKDEEPMLFEGIKFKGKKKRNRKKHQAKDTIKLSSESQNNNKANTIEKSAKKKHQIVEEDCDSAHSVDHSIDTNDAPNTIYSDIRSEGSQDSGKGGSSISGELRTVSDSDEQTSYDFLVPIDLVGPIIGKKGAFVKYIKEKSNVRLFVENKTDSAEDKFKMCTLVGSEININKALKLIRIKFPERAYPEFTLDCISPLVDGTVISQLFKSELIEGVNNHVIITDVITPDHFFVHNASSPDYALLSSLNFAMNDTFGNNKDDIPEVDLRTVSHGSVVATYSEDNWYRAQVIDVDEKKYESANVFFLDYGGCKKIDQCDMRPMHDSLISLSFQAIECSLANIAPAYGEWCEESLKIFESLTNGKMLFAQVIYKSDGVQFINLLAFDGFVTLSINDELINHGFAIYAPLNSVFRNETIQEIQIEPIHTLA